MELKKMKVNKVEDRVPSPSPLPKGEGKGEDAFTLVELMIVLVVIALLATISSVGALAMRVQANENIAKNSLKAIVGACESYRVTQTGYPVDLASLGAAYLSGGLESGEKAGYVFELKSGNSDQSFTCTAVPKAINYSGVKSFCVDSSNLIYVYENAPNLSATGNSCSSGGTPLSG
jgi:prepilin-type N-terminal cleavage/methylation domain-containing protein